MKYQDSDSCNYEFDTICHRLGREGAQSPASIYVHHMLTLGSLAQFAHLNRVVCARLTLTIIFFASLCHPFQLRAHAFMRTCIHQISMCEYIEIQSCEIVLGSNRHFIDIGFRNKTTVLEFIYNNCILSRNNIVTPRFIRFLTILAV